MYIDLVLVFEILKMVLLAFEFIGFGFLAVIVFKECRPVVYPWEKEEKRAEKKRIKDAERARKEFWGS